MGVRVIKSANWNHESGSSIVSALVTLAILSVVIVTAMNFFDLQLFSRQKIKSQIANQDLDTALTQELLSDILAELKSSGACFNIASLSGKPVLGSSTITYTTNIRVPGTSYPNDFEAAINRCRRPRTPSNSTSPNDNDIYFCAEIKPTSSGGNGSFMTAQYIFAEIYLELRDLQTGQPISCNSFLASRGENKSRFQGGMAMINLYWSQRSTKGTYNHNRQSYVSYLSDQ